MKYFLSCLGGAALVGLLFVFARPQGADITPKMAKHPFVVEQLFTSQGCSSCPSADRLLEKEKSKYTQNRHVVLLSYHVDYWNRLGWKDPFSKKKYTNLQYSYGGKSVYTPQAIINGKVGFVGSNASKLKNKIYNSLNSSAENGISLANVINQNSKIKLDYKVSGNLEGKKLKLVLALDNRKTVVKRGENRGETLSNSNVVVSEKSLSNVGENGKATIAIPSIVKPNEKLLIVAYLQKDDLEITGAVKAWTSNQK